ncbi:aromatic prenyltransferase [Streptomyces sp. SBT349]|uniref:aromatic prenyltransferase n=1 Tax=Streptomyces sp. SBT349 TaxID=1580539 RepID=UPI00066D9288|nr:aromatic prenyltransferase [Streptomyces sp. SBT349]
MSGAAALDEIYSAIEKSARLLDVPCTREKVWPILTAYGEALSEVAIIFSVSSGREEFDYTVQVPAGIDDPYAHAVANGFVGETDHPVGALLPDVQARVSVNEYFFDCGVVGGFQKLYASFPRNLQPVSKLADIPSMPRAVTDNAGYFAQHGLDDVSVIGIDYKRRTMNLYFQLPAAIAGNLDPKLVLSLLQEGGMPEPDERMLELALGAYRIYVTFSWDSSRVQRISFSPRPSRGLDLEAIADQLEPETAEFMRTAPFAYEGERVSISVPKWSADGGHMNLGSYYQVSPQLAALIASQERG